MTAITYLLQELLTKEITVFGLSEHWLLEQNQHILNNINSSYCTHVISWYTPRTFHGRQYSNGGVAILWHKNIDDAVQVINCNSDRIAAIKLTLRSQTIYIVQVNLPCASESVEEYKSEIDNLNDVLSQTDFNSKVVLMGDFNLKESSDSNVYFPNNAREQYLLGDNRKELMYGTTTFICSWLYLCAKSN